MSAPLVLTVAELQRQGLLLVEDGNHGEYRPRKDEFVEEGVAFIRAADMDAGRVLFGQAEKINSTARQRITKGIGAGGDVLLSHKGTVGKVAFAPLDAPPFVCSPQTTFWRTLNVEILDRHYLHAFLRSAAFHAQLDAVGGETDMAPYVSLTSQRAINVWLPAADVQRSIGSTLATLDAKIELNRRMNETLEAMAQAIFRDWFIDFGPVRRKLSGAIDPVKIMGGLTPDPVRAAEMTGLFPDDLDEQELPRGWCTKRIDDVLEFAYGKSMPKTERRDGAIPVYGSGGVSGYHDQALAVGPGIIVGRKGTVGSLYWEQGDFFAIDTVFYVAPRPGFALVFLWELLRTLGLNLMNTDAAVPGLNRSNVYRLEFPLAGPGVLGAFNELALPLRARIDANNLENRTLAETRDYLLPRMMSGEIRVAEAREIVDAAA